MSRRTRVSTSMYEFSGARRSSRWEILSFNEADTESTCGGIQGNAGTGGSSANYENVERVSGGGANEWRLLNLSGREDGVWVVDLLLESCDLGSMIVGCIWRWEQDRAAVSSGCSYSDGGAESSQASHVMKKVGERTVGLVFRWRQVQKSDRFQLKKVRVNRQLPEIVSSSIDPDILIVNMRFYKYPWKILHLCAKCFRNLNFFFFSSYSWLKNIKGK